MCQPLCGYTPLIIETEGGAIRLTRPAEGVVFDLGGTGHPSRYSWPEAGSGGAFLVLDRDRNGTIDGGRELFGNVTPQAASGAPNGFLALAEYDKPELGGNGDGIIDVSDAVYNLLRLWIDENMNGISEPTELFPLPQQGVNSISLDYRLSRRRDPFGNVFRYRAKIELSRKAAKSSWAWDVVLMGETHP